MLLYNVAWLNEFRVKVCDEINRVERIMEIFTNEEISDNVGKRAHEVTIVLNFKEIQRNEWEFVNERRIV